MNKKTRLKSTPEAAQNARKHTLTKYNLTSEDYIAILESQNNSCAICQKSQNDELTPFKIDHNHETKEVRGLLCNSCNAGLGFFKDNIDNINAAIEYLKINSSTEA